MININSNSYEDLELSAIPLTYIFIWTGDCGSPVPPDDPSPLFVRKCARDGQLGGPWELHPLMDHLKNNRGGSALHKSNGLTMNIIINIWSVQKNGLSPQPLLAWVASTTLRRATQRLTNL